MFCTVPACWLKVTKEQGKPWAVGSLLEWRFACSRMSCKWSWGKLKYITTVKSCTINLSTTIWRTLQKSKRLCVSLNPVLSAVCIKSNLIKIYVRKFFIKVSKMMGNRMVSLIQIEVKLINGLIAWWLWDSFCALTCNGLCVLRDTTGWCHAKGLHGDKTTELCYLSYFSLSLYQRQIRIKSACF